MLSVYEKHSSRKLLATILSIIVIAGCVVIADNIKHKNEVTGNTVSQGSTSASPTTASTSTSATSDTTAPTSTTTATSTTGASGTGTFTASSSYYVPHGNETIQVSVTLKDGVITDSSIQNSESDHESAQYQEDFASAYKSYVVGQKISGLKIGVIVGASDTTQGFNDALSQIAAKAQA